MPIVVVEDVSPKITLSLLAKEDIIPWEISYQRVSRATPESTPAGRSFQSNRFCFRNRSTDNSVRYSENATVSYSPS